MSKKSNPAAEAAKPEQTPEQKALRRKVKSVRRIGRMAAEMVLFNSDYPSHVEVSNVADQHFKDPASNRLFRVLCNELAAVGFRAA